MNIKKFPSFEAVILDLDGVITKTAATHTAAWKKTFDEYLKKREQIYNEPFNEFSQDDYLTYVDGKPRYEGVNSFLKSRGIDLPYGSPQDDPDTETVCGLGNRKNHAFRKILKKEGTEVYPSTLKLLKKLKKSGIPLAVASSSKNCTDILKTVDLLGLFDAQVDGKVLEELELKGKPWPDMFTKSSELLGTKPSNSIVVEDAASGVKAGSDGGFGLTLGIARKNNTDELMQNGADYVVTDLAEINGIKGLNDIFVSITSSRQKDN
jgi:beta-phosphoglucomutase family hydrolase